MEFIPYEPDPTADPDLMVFRKVHLCGGPLDGQVRRFQILPGMLTIGKYYIGDSKHPAGFHYYQCRELSQVSSRDTWADYYPVPPEDS
jgi:hypothetical protein